MRKALLNEVAGSFLLVGNGDTNYLIPHADFQWADPSGKGIITPNEDRRRDC